MLKIVSTISFSREVERLVIEDKLSYIEAVVQLIQANDIDFSHVAKLITPQVRARIEEEGRRLNIGVLRGCKVNKLEFETDGDETNE